MARDVVPVEDLENLEKDFREVAATIAECVRISREIGMNAVLIHAKTLRNKHLPEVIAWSEGTLLDVREQARAFTAGLKSRAALQVEKAEKEKSKREQRPVKKGKS